MKTIWKDVLTAAFMGLILPGIFLNFAVNGMDGSVSRAEALELLPQETLPKSVGLTMRLRSPGGATEEMDMDEYLVEVVLAEMPASFEMEALKAQTVAARTYTQKAINTGGKHGDGSVCTSAACCQGYLTAEAYLTKGGSQENLEKVRCAVLATSGQVLTYCGELIEATYFACSGGSTEDAAAVWGTSFPYLQARPSPGEEQADGFMDTVHFTLRQFQNSLGVMLSGHPKSWFGTTTYTEGGGVATMYIGGQAYTGPQLRSLLGLRSTAFTITVLEETIAITTYGHGHRVGMSQYGADAMAVQGSTYEEILAYYYPDTELIKIHP